MKYKFMRDLGSSLGLRRVEVGLIEKIAKPLKEFPYDPPLVEGTK